MLGIVQNFAGQLAGKKKYSKLVEKTSIIGNSSNMEELNLLLRKETYLYQMRKYRILKGISCFLFLLTRIVGVITILMGVVFAVSEPVSFSDSSLFFNLMGVVITLLGGVLVYISFGFRKDIENFSIKLASIQKNFRKFEKENKLWLRSGF